jgi:hypothetical protein
LAARQAEAPPPCEMLPATELEVAQRRIADLERKIGQQQVELDFFGKPCGRLRDHASRTAALA